MFVWWNGICKYELTLLLQLSAQTNAILVDDSSASMQVDQTENSVVARDGMQNGGTELVIYNSKVVPESKFGIRFRFYLAIYCQEEGEKKKRN